jgi:prepilin-type N-terminal cleavage/methylation domain-containing protein
MAMISASVSPRVRVRRRGFTLIELLVVIGILVLLASITIPLVINAYGKAEVARLKADLLTIETALEAYKTDFGDYPRPQFAAGFPAAQHDDASLRPNPPSGAQILARALVGMLPAREVPAPSSSEIPAQDGADGPGFRVRGTQGKVYPAYLAAEKARVSSNDLAGVLLDSNGNPILYFPVFNKNADLAVANGYVGENNYEGGAGERPLYNYFDEGNSSAPRMSIEQMRAFLGDYGGPGAGAMPDGAITPGPIYANEKAMHTGPFILWTAGSDGSFGPKLGGSETPESRREKSIACDDVVNFDTSNR